MLDMLGGKQDLTAKVQRLRLWFGQHHAHVVVDASGGGPRDWRGVLGALGIDLETHRLPARLLKRHGVHLHGDGLTLAALHLSHLAEIGRVSLAGRATKFIGDEARGRDRRLSGRAFDPRNQPTRCHKPRDAPRGAKPARFARAQPKQRTGTRRRRRRIVRPLSLHGTTIIFKSARIFRAFVTPSMPRGGRRGS